MQQYKCILLVDDDLVSSFLNKEILVRYGVTGTIHTAKNGSDALQFIQGRQNTSEPCPDLILLDINMPVMDGFEFLAEFQKLPASVQESVHIVILTSSSNRVDRDRAEKFQIKGYLNKPLTFDNLNAVFQQ
jgi:CheY-like chemotaxis protein